MRMINIIIFFVLFHLLLIGGLLWIEEPVFLLNFELAFFISGLIIFQSYRGYRKLVDRSIANEVAMNHEDPLKRVEDPYDLYDDEEDSGDEDFDLKAEKQKIKKESLKKMAKASPGHFSIGRLASYALLVIAFIGLKNNAVLDIAGFLTGITLGIVAATGLGMKLSR